MAPSQTVRTTWLCKPRITGAEDSSPESGSAILTPPPRLKWQVGDLPDACLRK